MFRSLIVLRNCLHDMSLDSRRNGNAAIIEKHSGFALQR